MRDHHCKTGYHDKPFYSCHLSHACRCDGCREHYNAWKRGEVETRSMVPAHPLLDRIDTEVARRAPNGRYGVTTLLGRNDRRTYDRARNRGTVSTTWAERIAHDHLGLMLEEIYGWDLHDTDDKRSA